jgi:hypothetical protein
MLSFPPFRSTVVFYAASPIQANVQPMGLLKALAIHTKRRFFMQYNAYLYFIYS